MSNRIARLLAASVLVGVVLTPSVATAGDCSISMSPNPGWRGANVTFTGSGFPPGSGFYVNLGGNNIHNGTTNTNGAFSFQYQIPNNFPVGTTNVFVADNSATCEHNPSYTINSGPPTTTTSTTTTTTTTLAPTTTAAVTTTSSGDVTTTSAATTTSAVDDTTTTSVAESGGDGGIDTIVIVLIVLVVLLAVGLAFALGRMRRT